MLLVWESLVTVTFYFEYSKQGVNHHRTGQILILKTQEKNVFQKHRIKTQVINDFPLSLPWFRELLGVKQSTLWLPRHCTFWIEDGTTLHHCEPSWESALLSYPLHFLWGCLERVHSWQEFKPCRCIEIALVFFLCVFAPDKLSKF